MRSTNTGDTWTLVRCALAGVLALAAVALIRTAIGEGVMAPDLVALVGAFICVVSPRIPGLVTVFALGLLEDVFTGRSVGLMAGASVIAFLLGVAVRGSSGHDRRRTPGFVRALIVAIVFSFTKGIVSLLLLNSFVLNRPITEAVPLLPIAENLLTAACAPLLFPILKKSIGRGWA